MFEVASNLAPSLAIIMNGSSQFGGQMKGLVRKK
jgi:hypothetical protein